MSSENKNRLVSDKSKQRWWRISLTMIAFFLIIFTVPLLYLIRGNGDPKYSIIESRQLLDFSFIDLDVKNKILDSFIQRDVQQRIEKASSDQFPYRMGLIRTAKAVDRLIIGVSYLVLSDPAIPSDMVSNLFITRDDTSLFYGPSKLNESIRTTIDYRIGNYNYLLKEYPDVNFFVYSVERIQNYRFNPLIAYYKEADGGQYLEYFEKQKPGELLFGKMNSNSLTDYFTNFYRTDHHWNHNGIAKAYYGIHELLKQKYPQITAPAKIDSIVIFPGIEYKGSYARSSFYPIRGEEFAVSVFDLPPYKTYENGKEINYGNREQYFAGNYFLEPYINHYGEYYGYDIPYLEFVFEDQTNRNILVIGDSYDNALLPLIASHYHHTYSVDLRYDPDFSLSKFLMNHPVDDILVVGENAVAYSTWEWVIDP